MSPLIRDLPLDLILEISLQLGLADAIALFSTCHSLRKVMSEKSFWIHALTWVRREEMHPIAVPLCSDLSTLSLPELQEAGKRTNRLMKNLMTPKPTIESIREMYVGAASGLIVIPGTGLVVVHKHGRAHVACWDIFTKECVASLVLPCNVAIDSAAFEEYGRVMLGAFATDTPSLHVIAICIDYRVRTAVTMSQVISHAFSHPHRFSSRWKVTVDHETLRVVAATYEPHRYHLFSVSFAGEERITEDVLPMIPSVSGHFPAPPEVLTVPSPSGPYFLRHMTTSIDVAHLAPSRHRVTNTVVPLAHSMSAFLNISTVPVDPWADVVRLSASCDWIEFCPASREAGELVFGPVTSYPLDLGRMLGIYSLTAGTSGLHALLVRSTKVDPLLLVRYIPGAPPVVRTMTMPSKPPNNADMQEGRLAFDDHLGLVIYIRKDGELVVLSYA
ncbi:hypothetical protein B0H11DRAFT_857649 [Mycena galericulata]|nr:hypothetical protein B0H11DRAFT_857649 [Mycena galericulata]